MCVSMESIETHILDENMIGYLNKNKHAFIIDMFWQPPKMLNLVNDNALMSRFGKKPINKINWCLNLSQFILPLIKFKY